MDKQYYAVNSWFNGNSLVWINIGMEKMLCYDKQNKFGHLYLNEL